MKTETSAGGIIVRKHRSSWQFLLILDMNRSWTFPKGKVEKGETKREAAIREIEEEVALRDLEYIASLPSVCYTYRRNGTVSKTVYYYMFKYNGKKIPVCQKNEGIREASWMPYAKAVRSIGYTDTNMKLLTSAKAILQT